jgi:hypothetical protein
LSQLPDEESLHWKSLEDFIATDYLNVSATMRIIERYSQSEEEKKEYIDFVAKDIVELRQHHSLAAMQEKFQEHDENMESDKMFAFGVEVQADNRDEAREKLLKLIGKDVEGIIVRG